MMRWGSCLHVLVCWHQKTRKLAYAIVSHHHQCCSKHKDSPFSAQVMWKAHDGSVLAMELFQVNQDSANPGPLRLITSGAACRQKLSRYHFRMSFSPHGVCITMMGMFCMTYACKVAMGD
jgi:hypothetical protein